METRGSRPDPPSCPPRDIATPAVPPATCCLCNLALSDEIVSFGAFWAHKGCADDWAHEAEWDEAQHLDGLEAQEW